MATVILRRAASRRRVGAAPSLPPLRTRFLQTAPSPPPDDNRGHPNANRANHLDYKHLLLPHSTQNPTLGLTIHLTNSDVWGLSSPPPSIRAPSPEQDRGPVDWFDEIDDMRLRKDLFYKTERKDSMEHEESSVIFHKTKRNRNKEEICSRADKRISNKHQDPNRSKRASGCGRAREHEEKRGRNIGGDCKGLEEDDAIGNLLEVGFLSPRRRERTPTFNQLTDPYHLPFCLDIYVSKGSVRACVVHRVTSKVVVVAHSISKDMKFDLKSRKDAAACTAVGAVLAQRAVADDIHNVVYTPRKGEKIEGKLQLVLQSIIDSGVDVRVKIKQRKPTK